MGCYCDHEGLLAIDGPRPTPPSPPTPPPPGLSCTHCAVLDMPQRLCGVFCLFFLSVLDLARLFFSLAWRRCFQSMTEAGDRMPDDWVSPGANHQQQPQRFI